MKRDAWEFHLSHFSERINKKLRSLIREKLAHGEDICYPFGYLSSSLDSSTNWVSVYIFEMKEPKGKILSCIREFLLCTTHISNEKWSKNLWFLYDSLNIHGWTWDCHMFIENINEVCLCSTLYTESHIFGKC